MSKDFWHQHVKLDFCKKVQKFPGLTDKGFNREVKTRETALISVVKCTMEDILGLDIHANKWAVAGENCLVQTGTVEQVGFREVSVEELCVIGEHPSRKKVYLVRSCKVLTESY